MSRTETTSPTSGSEARLGVGYYRVLAAGAISNIGDGIDLAALPLLAALLTRDPMAFAGVTVAQRIPWLLFALQAGVVADRLDRKRVMATVNALRFGLMGLLSLAVWGGWASLALLYLVAFLLGTAETLFDNAAQAILPALVPRAALEKANGRLFAAETVANQFAGPPLGGLLFGVAAALPMAVDAATFLASAILIAGVVGSFRPARSGPPRSVRTDIMEGLRWLWNHRLLRTLALLLGLMNGMMMGAFAILGLFALEVLGLNEVGFGFLLTASAVGSVIASLAAGWLVERVGRGPVLLASIAAGGLVSLAIGLSSSPVVVAGLSVLFGLHAVLWNVVTVSLRQTIIPDDLLGRVNSVYRFVGWGSMPVGSALGGILAGAFGLRAPWIVSGVAILLGFVAALPVVNTRTIEAARAAAGAPDQTS